jgi:uncharacterized protein DUF6152
MKTRVLSFIALGLGFVVISIPVFAHHGRAAYDFKKTITLTGTITAFEWTNPHCLIYIDVKTGGGEIQHWTLEMSPPSTMSRRGWNQNTLRRGDQVTTQTHPAKNGITLGISSNPDFIMKFAVNGKELPSSVN